MSCNTADADLPTRVYTPPFHRGIQTLELTDHTDLLHDIFEHELNEYFLHTDLTDLTDLLHGIFEHEIRRRPTDRREVIKRI